MINFIKEGETIKNGLNICLSEFCVHIRYGNKMKNTELRDLLYTFRYSKKKKKFMFSKLCLITIDTTYE